MAHTSLKPDLNLHTRIKKYIEVVWSDFNETETLPEILHTKLSKCKSDRLRNRDWTVNSFDI